MKIVVTGSSGCLGKALVKHFRDKQHDVIGFDIKESCETTVVGSITDSGVVAEIAKGADAIIHTATLHKLHINTHSKSQFIDVNINGTQNLLESAIKNKVRSFIFTSSTSTFGLAMRPPKGAPAVWVNENLRPIPKNIYGATKVAAEDLCRLAHLENNLNCIILKTSRFFPKENDLENISHHFSQENIQTVEYLYRRVAIADVVSAHKNAIDRAPKIGFDRFIITATTPFHKSDCQGLSLNAPAILSKYYPSYERTFEEMGWKMFPILDRVYDNTKAREYLEWTPKYNFNEVLAGATTLCAG